MRWSRPRVAGTALALALLAAGVVLDGRAAHAGPIDPALLGPAPAHALHTLPDWTPFGGMAFGHDVWLKADQQTEYGVGHELVHVRQQAAHPVWFWVSYPLLPGWRLHWEAEAYAVQARARCPIDGEHGLAAYLSGPAYLWVAGQARAAAEIRKFE
jgi:hypothetical protein